jgi:ribosomal-protein-serine acetyltransferase
VTTDDLPAHPVPGGLVVRVDDGIELRMPHEDDAAALFSIVEAERTRLSRWLPWVELVTNEGVEREFLRRTLREAAEGRSLTLAVWVGGEIAGTVGMPRIEPFDRCCEIGYWIADAHAGKGIMTRSVGALTTYCFRERGMHRIEIVAAEGNRRSRAIPERLGYIREATLRARTLAMGGFRDAVLYAVLEREWDATAGRGPGTEGRRP